MRSVSTLLLLVAAAAACKDPIAPQPQPDEAVYLVTVQAEPHSWASYRCTVTASLTSLSAGTTSSDSVAVGAGEQASFALSVAKGAYTATISLRWEGRPGTAWDLVGMWDSTATVTPPDTARVACP